MQVMATANCALTEFAASGHLGSEGLLQEGLRKPWVLKPKPYYVQWPHAIWTRSMDEVYGIRF